ncbi:Uncharacterized protein PPKH_4944 [Pseudomonas putida]|nr:Uncharacterized protein PPKH_4944 [Pseudomonas putida]
MTWGESLESSDKSDMRWLLAEQERFHQWVQLIYAGLML